MDLLTKFTVCVILMFRWAIIACGAVVGFFLGGTQWYDALIYGAPCALFAILLLIFVGPNKHGISRGAITDGILKSLCLGALLSTVNGFGGYHSNHFLAWLIVPAMIVMSAIHAISKHKKLLEGWPSVVDVFLISLILAWSVEALIFVVTNSRHYDFVSFNDHKAALSVAGLFFAVVIGAFQAITGYVEATSLLQSVRSLAQGNVAKTRLTELRKHLHEELRDDRIQEVKCYHSTSLLFGFWLNPLATREEDVSVLSHALKQTAAPRIDVKLIGPSNTALEYLVTSRLYLQMQTQTLGGYWESFLDEVIAAVKSQVPEIPSLLTIDNLRDEKQLIWWHMLDVLRWYLLWVYYKNLAEFYSEAQLRGRCDVHVVESTRYDGIIPKAFAGASYCDTARGECVPANQSTQSAEWHLGELAEWQGRPQQNFSKAAASIDQIFFPEYAFAILSPGELDVHTGMRSKVLLCHNVLTTLRFARFQEQPPSILRLMNDEFIDHYEHAFNSEWPDSNPNGALPRTPNSTVLTLAQCATNWNRRANHAWSALNGVVEKASN